MHFTADRHGLTEQQTPVDAADRADAEKAIRSDIRDEKADLIEMGTKHQCHFFRVLPDMCRDRAAFKNSIRRKRQKMLYGRFSGALLPSRKTVQAAQFCNQFK